MKLRDTELTAIRERDESKLQYYRQFELVPPIADKDRHALLLHLAEVERERDEAVAKVQKHPF